MSEISEVNAQIAARLVQENGGFLSFDDYNKLMFPKLIISPMNWIAGVGMSREARKSNLDKMCVFEACKLGLLKQTQGGYRIPVS